MSALVKIRSERDRMSAIERRIADFVLENAQLLRDYSSQQLANALGISQSSVVKFCQKLGFKGYPDLKLSISEALVRADNGNGEVAAESTPQDRKSTLASSLWKRKSEAEEATRLINTPEAIATSARAIAGAGKVFIIGLGEDDIHARAFALKLSLLGILSVHNFDPAHMTASMSSAGRGDGIGGRLDLVGWIDQARGVLGLGLALPQARGQGRLAVFRRAFGRDRTVAVVGPHHERPRRRIDLVPAPFALEVDAVEDGVFPAADRQIDVRIARHAVDEPDARLARRRDAAPGGARLRMLATRPRRHRGERGRAR